MNNKITMRRIITTTGIVDNLSNENRAYDIEATVTVDADGKIQSVYDGRVKAKGADAGAPVHAMFSRSSAASASVSFMTADRKAVLSAIDGYLADLEATEPGAANDNAGEGEQA